MPAKKRNTNKKQEVGQQNEKKQNAPVKKQDNNQETSSSEEEKGCFTADIRYPIYTIATASTERYMHDSSKEDKNHASTNISDRLVLVGGGGGVSKTGIPNAITIFEWNTKLGLVRRQTVDTEFNIVNSVRFDDSRMIFISENSLFSGKLDCGLLIKPLVSTEAISRKNSKDDLDIKSLTIGTIDTHKYVFVGTTNGKVQKWIMPKDRTDFLLKGEFLGHSDTEEINSIDFCAKTLRLVTSSSDATCRIWNVLTGNCEIILRSKQTKLEDGIFKGCWFSKTGDVLFTIITTRKKSILTKWRINRLNAYMSKKIVIGNSFTTASAMSPNDKYICVSTSSTEVSVFRTDSLNCVMKCKPHSFVVSSVAFSPDSTHIITGSLDYSLKCTKIHSRREIIRMIILILGFLFMLLLAFYAFPSAVNKVVSAASRVKTILNKP